MPTLETQITAVTVFPDRARVTRAGQLALEPGPQTIVIENLPRALDASSVRAAGAGNARLNGVQIVHRYHAEINPSAAQAAQEKLQALLDQDKILSDETDAWQARLTVVKNIGEQGGENFARMLARGKLSLEGLTNTLDYMSNSFEAASNVLRDLYIRRRELQKQIEAAKREAEKLANAAARESHDAQISIDVAAAGTVALELTYNVHGASWQALYDARLDGDRLEWNCLAQVQQQTGEDWNMPYALTLSTATLATGIDKPALPPWRIDAYHPPQPRALKVRGGPPLAAAAPAPQMMLAAESAPPPPMAYDIAEVETSGASVTYKIATPRAIPSDGEPHQVNITTLNLNAALDYFCAPKADEHAFVRAKFKNASEYLMLAGEVSLYHGPEFVGTRSTETIAPNQEVELFLGAEERLRVERKEIQHEVNKTGLIGNNASAALAYRITVENPARELARVTVLDQMPVSQHPDIKVRLRDATPKPATQNEQGELAWNVEIKKGDKQQIEFSVTVEYPKEMRVMGL
ncbi:MAG: mucoidy inhibitor MuiA family protein [Chloroflexi bacterium]|nr:mucoidy inhibitor MuiA family protein [Chloroflexota bacterium]